MVSHRERKWLLRRQPHNDRNRRGIGTLQERSYALGHIDIVDQSRKSWSLGRCHLKRGDQLRHIRSARDTPIHKIGAGMVMVWAEDASCVLIH